MLEVGNVGDQWKGVGIGFVRGEKRWGGQGEGKDGSSGRLEKLEMVGMNGMCKR